MEVIIVALIVSLLAPTINGLITNRNNRKVKIEDWAREDAVAEQAAQAAALLLEANERVAESTSGLATQLVEIHGQAEQIHTLVNSNLQAAMQGQLEAMKAQVILMRNDKDTTAEAIVAKQKEIDILAQAIRDKERQTQLAKFI